MNGQFIYALAGSVIDCICDSCRYGYHSHFTYAFNTQFIDNLIVFFRENDIELIDICMHWNMVLGEILVHIFAKLFVQDGFLIQRFADAPDHGT